MVDVPFPPGATPSPLDLDALSLASGEPREALARRHAHEGLLRRIAASPHAARWVLRGSFLSRAYCAPWPRPAADLDLLDLDDFDRSLASARLHAVASIDLDDGCSFDADARREELIWEGSPSPGVRCQIPASAPGWRGEVQLDVAFHDPVFPPPRVFDLPTLGGQVRLWVCTRETLLAWKIHGLFEKGLGTFRPKDLWDISLLSSGFALDDEALRGALRVAFESRKTPLRWAERLARGELGQSRWSLRKWERFREDTGPHVPPIREVVASIAARLGPTLEACIAAEKGP